LKFVLDGSVSELGSIHYICRCTFYHYKYHCSPCHLNISLWLICIVSRIYSRQMLNLSSIPCVNNKFLSSQGFKPDSRGQWISGAFDAGKSGWDINLTTELPSSVDGKKDWNYNPTPFTRIILICLCV
jgi:hypothetical protein